MNCQVKRVVIVVLQAGVDFISRSGLDNLPQVLMNGIPLKRRFLSQDLFEEGVVSEILSATTDIQQAVYRVCCDICLIYIQAVQEG